MSDDNSQRYIIEHQRNVDDSNAMMCDAVLLQVCSEEITGAFHGLLKKCVCIALSTDMSMDECYMKIVHDNVQIIFSMNEGCVSCRMSMDWIYQVRKTSSPLYGFDLQLVQHIQKLINHRLERDHIDGIHQLVYLHFSEISQQYRSAFLGRRNGPFCTINISIGNRGIC